MTWSDTRKIGMPRMFDPAPLLALFPDEPSRPDANAWRKRHGRPAPGTVLAIGEACGVPHETITRWRHGRRITWSTADRVCISIGIHPGLVWPEWFDVEGAHDWHSCTEACDCNPKALVAS